MSIANVLRESALLLVILKIAMAPCVVYGQVGATAGVKTVTPDSFSTVDDAGSRGESLGSSLIFHGTLSVVDNRSLYLVTASDRMHLVGPMVQSLLKERIVTWKIEGRLVDANTIYVVKASPLKR